MGGRTAKKPKGRVCVARWWRTACRGYATAGVRIEHAREGETGTRLTAAMASPSCVDVPRPSSSRITRLFGPASRRILELRAYNHVGRRGQRSVWLFRDARLQGLG